MTGFVDLQVNGYVGVDFSAPGLSPTDVARATQALLRAGTQAYCPTVVTCAAETYREVLPALAEAMSAPGGEHLLGVHLEGPFISPEPGAVGIHDPACVRAPSISALDELCDLAGGNVALLTVAPEIPGAIELIRHAVKRKIIVGIGHSMAPPEIIAQAAEAGARLSTHLGNGIPDTIHRHENPLWAQLADPRLAAMLISDGFHVPKDFLLTALAAKGVARCLVTSDCAPVAGLAPGIHEAFGTRVALGEDGSLRTVTDHRLAGSGATMRSCLNTLADLGVGVEDLLRLGRDNPLAALGLDDNRLAELPNAGVEFRDGKFHENSTKE